MTHKTKRFFQKLFINTVRARQQKAAEDVATLLIRENRDFRGCSHADLTRAIMSKRKVKMGEISL